MLQYRIFCVNCWWTTKVMHGLRVYQRLMQQTLQYKLLQKAHSSEKSYSVARRLGLLIILLNENEIFVMAAIRYSCDRTQSQYTITGRLTAQTYLIYANPFQTSHVPGVPQRYLENYFEAKQWYKNHTFTSVELGVSLKEISGVNLGMSSQTLQESKVFVQDHTATAHKPCTNKRCKDMAEKHNSKDCILYKTWIRDSDPG